MLAVDPLELRGQRGQGGAGALVPRVGLELDPQAAERLERVPEQQVLRLGVRTGAPRGGGVPGVPDLERRCSGRTSGSGSSRRRRRPSRTRTGTCRRPPAPPGSRPRCRGSSATPGSLVRGGRAQPLDVPLLERLERDDPAAQRRPQVLAPRHARMSTLRRPMPIYEYVCMECESHFEELVRNGRRPPAPTAAARTCEAVLRLRHPRHAVEPSFGRPRRGRVLRRLLRLRPLTPSAACPRLRADAARGSGRDPDRARRAPGGRVRMYPLPAPPGADAGRVRRAATRTPT